MLKRLAAEPAKFSAADLESVEKRTEATGQTRRAALVFLAHPGKWMLETIAKDRQFAVAAAGLQECIDDYLKHHEAIREADDLFRGASPDDLFRVWSVSMRRFTT